MFTGIIEEIGKILSITDKKMEISAKTVLTDTRIGDSIAVNGVCLTVTDIKKQSFAADISPETYKVTALDEMKAGDTVNLERAMPANGRFGGHVVTGHIDGIGKVTKLQKLGDFYNLYIEIHPNQTKYTIQKGSIAINGISLTIAEVTNNLIKIAVIPHTFENTSLSEIKCGDNVNIETDIMAKYVEKFLSTSDNKSGISMEFLRENGF